MPAVSVPAASEAPRPAVPDPAVPDPGAASAPDLRAPGALADALAGVVLGEAAPIRLAVAAFVAGGHVLIEDAPGVGKTLLAKALAAGIGGTFRRIQGTADLLPSEITGVDVFEPGSGTWAFRPGPLFAHVVLVDELNRATPRAQSALLEAMAEGQVSVDGTSRPLPDPFFVVATQNPFGDAGTFPLVPGQRDRFAVSIRLGVPIADTERAILLGHGGEAALARMAPVADTPVWVDTRAAVRDVLVDAAVADYVLALVHRLRGSAGGAGLSTRAALTVVHLARAWAVLDGRRYVLPDDVKAVAPAVLGHRLASGSGGSGIAGGAAEVHEALGQVAVPPGR